MRSVPNVFGYLQKIFIEPPYRIQEVGMRRKSRLLNVFLLSVFLIFLLEDGTSLHTLPGYRHPWYAYLLLFSSYLLNRIRFYNVAAGLALAMFPVVIIGNVASGNASNPISSLYSLVPGLILAGILLSLRATAFLALLEIGVILLMPALAPAQFPRAMVVGPVSTLAISALLVMASMRFRDQIERDRQEMVRQTEDRYRNIVENAIDGIFQSTAEGRFISVNAAMARMYGYATPQDMIDSVTDIPSQLHVKPETRVALLERMSKGEKIMGFEAQHYRRDRSIIWTSVNVQAIRDDLGRVRYYEGTIEDITHRKQVETERRQAEETLRQFRQFMDDSNDAIFLIDPQTSCYIDFNRSAHERLGYTREELSQLKVIDVAQHIPTMDVWRQRVDLVRERGGLIFDSVYLRKDRTTFPVEVSARMLEYVDRTVMVATVRDITERRQADTALRESEERFRKIFYSSPIAICITTIEDGRLLNANQAYWDITGYDPGTSIGRNAEELKMWDEPHERLLFVKELREKRSLSNLDDYFYHTDGTLKKVMSFYELIQIGDEDCILSMFYDMSIQKQLEAERENLIRQLGAHNAESETLREGLASILGTFEFSEIIQNILDQIRRVVPYDSASIWRLEGGLQRFISGRNLPSMFDSGDVTFSLEGEANSALPILTGEVPYILNNNVQEELTDFNEEPHTYVQSWLAIPLKTRGRIIGLIALDGKTKGQFNSHHAELAVTFADQVAIALENSRLFTELQNELFMREKLIQELESKNVELERFTYTVSHDLKSPLVTINGFLGYLERDAETGNVERLRNDIRRIQDAVNRMHRLLGELLELSRIGRLMNQPEEIHFGDLVREVLELVHGRLEARHISVQVQPDLPVVHGDRQRLTEVVQNLIDNAGKFMGDQIDPRVEIGQRGEEDGKPVLFVRDNGIGIAAEYHDRIFGLFNKLDVKTEGTGIGLALVKRIIEVHGGRIWVESQVGKGATFYFTLPYRAGAAA